MSFYVKISLDSTAAAVYDIPICSPVLPLTRSFIMTITAAVGSFVNWQERHQARRDHHPLELADDDDDEEIAVDLNTDSPQADVSVTEVNTGNPSQVHSSSRLDSSEHSASEDLTAEAETMPEDEETGTLSTMATATSPGPTVRQAMLNGDGTVRTDGRVSLQELEEERELSRRKTSACVLLAVFILFRLWIEAIVHADFGLLMLCLVGTSWTARWIRYNRDREEELDRRIQTFVERAEDGTTDVNRHDLRMLSFQAQLAMAIMESQRNMMEGGFGHPDGHGGHLGVSDQAREQWEDFQFKGKYGSVTQSDDLEKDGNSDDNVCTICLGEYEDGEKLVKLPCNHIYHEDCVSSWTSNHTRCPLCNFDLSQITDQASVAGTATTVVSSLSSRSTDEIV